MADPDPANPDAALENQSVSDPTQKRRRKGGRPSATGAGKGVGGVVDPAHIVDLKTLPSSSPLQDVALQGRGQVGLQLRVFVGQAFVVNKTDKEIKISVGMLLCGFGKGKFDRNSATTGGKYGPECNQMFTIQTCDDLVFTTKLEAVKDVVHDQKVKNPEAKLSYHSMFEVVGTDKKSFGVKQEHEVFFIPALSGCSGDGNDGDAVKVINQGSVGAVLPSTSFDGSHCLVKAWAVKWAAIGLLPIRPLVLFKQSCDLPAGQALSLL